MNIPAIRTAHFQIFFCKDKTIGRFRHDAHAVLSRVSFGISNEYSIGLLVSPTDTTSKLMELTKPETISIHDNHNRRIGNIDPNFYNRCRNQNVSFSLFELLHNLVFFITLHLTV